MCRLFALMAAAYCCRNKREIVNKLTTFVKVKELFGFRSSCILLVLENNCLLTQTNKLQAGLFLCCHSRMLLLVAINFEVELRAQRT